MRKPLKIINIDGLDGIGKTTQVSMLSKNFSEIGVPILVLQLSDNVESALDCADKIWNFLDKNPDGVVFSDGSVARMIVLDLLDGMTQKQVSEKYREVLHQHECLNHKYGMINILMVMDDISECHRRVIKREKLFGKESVGIVDFHKEAIVVKSMELFDDTILSNNLKFHVVRVEADDSVLETEDEIWTYLEDNYLIKKPSIEG